MRIPHALPARFTLALAILLVAPAARGQVRDEGKFFSEDAVRQANFDLRDIRDQYGVSLVIETFASVPDELRPDLERLGRDRFFPQWAGQRGQQAGANVITLITREPSPGEPSRLQVEVDDRTRQKAFTPADRDRYRDVLLTSFREKRFDEGLLQGVRLVRETIQRNTGGGDGAVAQAPPTRAEDARTTPVPESDDPRARRDDAGGGGGFSIGKIVFWGVLIFGGLWLLRKLFSRRTQQPGPGGYPGRPGYGANDPRNDPRYDPQQDPRYGGAGGYGRGGGGFGTGLGGGLLGGLLGGWLGGHVFGSGRAHGQDTAGNADAMGSTGAGHLPQQNPNDFADDPQAAGTGGSFSSDDAGGGGDFGGDSGGGGDF
jgi:hypothetical protein